MLFNLIDQDRVPSGFDQQVASVQATTTATEMWYDASHLNDTTPVLRPGALWDDNFGNYFQYVKAGANLTVGQFVSLQAPTTGTSTAAGSTVYVQVTNVTTTANEVGNYLWQLDAVGQTSSQYRQTLRRIKSSTVGSNATFVLSQQGSTYGNNIYDLDYLPRTATNGAALAVIRPFNVISATASTLPIGVALGTITSGNWTIIQVAGLAMIQANNVGAATAVGVPGAMQASGVFTGAASASQSILGTSIIPLYAHNSSTTSLIPAFVNFMGT